MLNKTSNAVRLATLGLVSAGTMMASQASMAEMSVSASIEASNIYLYRGLDLGGGAVVAGDISVDSGFGLYGGIWGSSGDAVSQEIDLWVGYALEVGDFTIDLSVWNYMYPSDPEGADSFGDFSEAALAVSGFGVTLEYYKVITQTDSHYYAASYEMDSFGVKVGMHDSGGDTMTHVDLSYAANDNLSFTVSQVVAQDEVPDDTGILVDPYNDRPLFKVSYTLGWDL